MRIKFWGVRGSIACPGPDTVIYGGNTPCIEIYLEDIDRVIIIDAGSGIRALGNDLKQRCAADKGLKADIFLSHTHWDHIMGFPFFEPIYLPDTTLNIYGPETYEEETLGKIIGDQLSYRYFPVRHSELASTLSYHQLKECELDLGQGIHLKTKFLNHTLQCLGYRFEYKGKSLCTAFDTEPFRNLFDLPRDSPDYDPFAAEEGEKVAREENQRIIKFCHGADVLVHDAQYTVEEYEKNRKGWGHSTFEHAVETGLAANVQKLYFYHHEPTRTDSDLAAIEGKWRREKIGGSGLEVFVAREGVTVEL